METCPPDVPCHSLPPQSPAASLTSSPRRPPVCLVAVVIGSVGPGPRRLRVESAVIPFFPICFFWTGFSNLFFGPIIGRTFLADLSKHMVRSYVPSVSKKTDLSD